MLAFHASLNITGFTFSIFVVKIINTFFSFANNTNFTIYLFMVFFEFLHFISIKSSYINRRKMENSRTCEICNVNVHRASMQKHLRSEKTFKKFKTK